MSDLQDPAGMAALSICEALLLALQDRNLLPEREIVGILRDAAAAHENAQNWQPFTGAPSPRGRARHIKAAHCPGGAKGALYYLAIQAH